MRQKLLYLESLVVLAKVWSEVRLSLHFALLEVSCVQAIKKPVKGSAESLCLYSFLP